MNEQVPSEELCACVSHDALRCMQIRYNIDPDEDFMKQRCECICHDRYDDEEDDYGHDPDLDDNGVCRVCGKYEPE